MSGYNWPRCSTWQVKIPQQLPVVPTDGQVCTTAQYDSDVHRRGSKTKTKSSYTRTRIRQVWPTTSLSASPLSLVNIWLGHLMTRLRIPTNLKTILWINDIKWCENRWTWFRLMVHQVLWSGCPNKALRLIQTISCLSQNHSPSYISAHETWQRTYHP